MNKHLYRVIFNKARGLLMVVAENVRSDGKSGSCVAGSPTGVGSGAVSVTLDPFRFALMLALGLILPSAATAAIVADASAPAGQQPTVIFTANGVPQVDIQTPSAAGVSRNAYNQFDVSDRGAILNNSRIDVQSQLGGWITGNQRLNDGTARIILNEVNSSAASHLNGYIEVAGDRAQVVIANPAGISCAGCGFINADRATLTTGAPIMNEGHLDGYAVSRGEISIQGAGLDGRGTAYTDIIARSVRINAGIWANDLKVTTGSNYVDADHTQAAPFASLGAKPEFAIDVAHLGGMYAGKIRLVGTEHGVGVRNAGTLAAESGDLMITLDGRLVNSGLLQGKQDIQVTTEGGVRNSGTISAQREALLNTAADLDNSAGRLNAARLDLSAQSLKNRDGDLEQTGTQALAIVAASLTNREAGRIGVAEAPNGSESGAEGTPTTPDAGATPPSAEGGAGGESPNPTPIEQLADGQLRIGERLDNDAGRIRAGGKVTLATENLNNDEGRLGVHQLSVSGGELSNQAGELTVTTGADISATRMSNDDGQLSVGGTLALNAAELSNRSGKLIHSDTSVTALSVTERFDNTDGLLASNAAGLTLDVGVLVNEDGRLDHAGELGLTLRLAELHGAGGQISTGGALNLEAGDIDHRGATLTATQVSLRADNLDNRAGSLLSSGSESNRLDVAGRLDNSQGGSIASNGDLSLSAAHLSNAQGSIQHAGDGQLAIQAGTLDGVAGTLAGNGTLTLGGGQLDLGEGNTSAKRIQVEADSLRTAGGRLVATGGEALELRLNGSLDNAGGILAGNGVLDLDVGALDNRSGTLQSSSDQASHIQVAGSLDNGAGTLATTGELILTAGEMRNQGGQVRTAGDSALRLEIDGLLDNSGDGFINTAGELAIQAQTLDNRAGRIEHAGDAGLSIAVETLSGAGGTLASNSRLTLSGERIDLANGSTSAEQMQVQAGDLITAGGRMVTTGNDTLDLQIRNQLNNAGGTIVTNGALDVNAGALNNRAGTLQSASDQASHIQVAGSLDNGAGTLATTGELRLTASELLNVGGRVQSAGDSALRLDIEGLLDNSDDGRIATAGELAIQAQTLDNRAGRIEHAGDAGLSIAVETLSGAGGTLASNSELTLSGERLDLSEGDTRAERIAVEADELITAGGRLIASGFEALQLWVRGLLDNANGAIVTNGALDLGVGALNNRAGTLQSASDQASHIQVAGSLDNGAGTLATTGELRLTASELLNVGGRVQSAGDSALRLDIEGLLDNSDDGRIATAGELAIQAQTLDNRAGRIEHAGDAGLSITVETLSGAGGTLASNSELTLSGERLDLGEGDTRAERIAVEADELITAGGRLIASGFEALQLWVRGLLDNANGAIVTNGALDVNAGALNNRAGTLQSASDQASHIRVAGSLDNGAGTLATNGDLTLAADALRNVGGRLRSAGDNALRLDIAGLLDNSDDGRIAAAGDLEIQAQTLDNRAGAIEHAGEGLLSIEVNRLDGAEGTLAGNGALNIAAEHLDLSGGDTSARHITVEAGELITAGGRLIASGFEALQLRVRGLLDNAGGAIVTNGALDLGVGALNNRAGTLQSTSDQASRIQVSGSLDNGAGTLATNGDLTLAADTLRNVGGRLQSAGDNALRLEIDGLLDNSDDGRIVAAGDLEIQAQTLDNRAGAIEHAGEGLLSIAVNRLDGAEGTLAGNGALNITAEHLDLSGGDTSARHIAVEAGELITAGGRLIASGLEGMQLRVRQLLNNEAGLIAGNGDMRLDAQRLVNEGGAIEHAGEGLLSIEVNRLDGAGGSLVGNGALNITGEHIDLNGGDTSARRIAVEAGELITAGGRLIASGFEALQLRVRDLLDNTDGVIAGNGALELSAGELDNRAGTLQAAGGEASQVRVDGAFHNNGGTLATGGDLRLQAAEVLNTGGQLRSVHGGAELVVEGLLENSAGLVTAGGDMRLSAQHLVNEGGAVEHAGEGLLSIEVNRLDGAEGTLVGNGALNITGEHIDLSGGDTSARRIAVEAGELITAGGRLIASGFEALQLRVRDLLDNTAGTIAGNGALELSAGELDNRAGLLQAAGEQASQVRVAGDLDNRGGVLASAGGLNLQAATLRNAGGLTQAGNGATRLAIDGLLDNGGDGRIAAAGDLEIQAQTLDNRAGAIEHAGDGLLSIAVSRLDGAEGTLAGNGALNITAEHLDLSGADTSAQHIAVEADELINAGGRLIASGLEGMQLRVRQLLNNEAGLIAGNGDMRLDAQRLVNEGGAIEHAGEGLLSIEVNRLDGAGGSLVGNGALEISGERIDLANGNTQAQRIEMTADELISAGGRLIANGLETLRLRVRDLLDNTAGTIAGNGGLELSAGELDNRAGTLQTAGGEASQVRVEGVFDNRGGRLATSGDTALDTGELRNNAGVLQSGGALDLTVDGLLDNRAGALVSRDAGRVSSEALDNREGGMLASLNSSLELTNAGQLQNAGGTVQAAGALTLDTHGLNNTQGALLGGSLTLDTHQRELDNRGGTLAATTAGMVLRTGALDNTGGLLQAAGDLSADTRGAALSNGGTGELGGILAGGNLSIGSGDLDNRGGLIHAQNDLTVNADRFDNSDAGVAGSGGSLLMRVDALENGGGTLHADRDLEAQVTGMLANNGGLIFAGNLLKLSAAAVLNRHTGVADPAAPRGLQGGQVVISTGHLDNRSGSIAADEHIALTGADGNSTLDNTQGTVSSAGSLAIEMGDITNTGGTLLAAVDNRIAARSMSGDGSVLSQGDLSLTLKSDFNNSGEVVANGQARVETSGSLTNGGSLRAGDLNVRASLIDNLATGEISGGRTHIATPGALTNRGLIDGQWTRIDADALENLGTGRIYGDHIAIAARSLSNREETIDGATRAATIAARERLDLGVSTLLNREDALIFSAGSGSRALNIGGALSAEGWAEGWADSVENRSATIESLGGLSLAATSLLNVDDHFQTAEVQTLAPTAMTLIRPEGDSGKYDISNFEKKSWSRAGYYRWKGDTDIGELGVLGEGPIVGVREVTCLGEDEESCTFLPGSEYPADDPAWGHFELPPPDPAPHPPRWEDYQIPEGEQPEPGASDLAEAAYQAAVDAWQLAYAAWKQETEARYDALDESVQRYNSQFDSQKIKDWTKYEVIRTEYKTEVIDSARAIIRSGGNMRLEGVSLTNRHSQIIAGGSLTLVGGELSNEDEVGEHRISEYGTSQFTYSKWRGGFKRYHERRYDSVIAYNPADETRKFNLNAAQVITYANGQGSDFQVDTRTGVAVQASASGAVSGSLEQEARAVAGDAAHLEGLTTFEQSAASAATGNQVAAAGGLAGVEGGASRDGQALDAIRGQRADQVSSSVGGGITKGGAAGASEIQSIGAVDGARAAQAQVSLEIDAASAAKSQGIDAVDGARAGQTHATPAVEAAAAAVASGVAQSTPNSVGPVGSIWDLPTSSLFKVSPGGGGFLVETDPRFIQQRTWLNSDYLLGQLSLDAAGMQQRIGDGFYEQWLIREQVAQLTGRRYLESYADDEAQYRALMEAGVTLAQDWNLRPGVALSAEQLAQLTSDIVWLVEETVRLPDGTYTTALVPKVYLVPREGDLDGNGTLISAESVDLRLEGDLVNSGTIAGRGVVQLSGDSLRNLDGRITGADVLMQARTDLENLGGTIDARDSLMLSAGRDLSVTSTTQSASEQVGKSDFSRTNLDRVAGLYVSNPGGALVMAAGRDVTLTGAEVTNAGAGGQTLISAGRDLTLASVQTSLTENSVADKNNYLKLSRTEEKGTRIDVAGDLILSAGHDLNARAAQISSEAGAVLLNAGNNVNLTAGEETHNFSEAHKHKHSGVLGSTTTTSRYSEEERLALGTSVSGHTVQVQAGNDLTLEGGSLVSDMGTVLVAGNDVNILAAQNSYNQSQYEKEKKSGVIQSGAAVTVGKQMQSADSQQSGTYATASTVGSLGGDVTIQAGGDYRQVGSHVVAPGGDIAIRAERVEIVEARETSQGAYESKFRQSGVTVAVSSPVISALQTADQMKQASSRTDDRRLQALAAVTTGLSVSNAASALGADPAALGGLNISVTAGSSKSDSRTETRSDTAAGSTLSAGGNVSIVASGAGQASDLTIQGGAVTAGGDVLLKAEGDVALLAARNSSEMERESSSSSVGAGVAFTVGAGGAGPGVTANASAAKGDGESQDTTWTHTQISAGNRLTLESGGDITLRGAVASGEQVVADIGGNLAIESLQDIHTFRSKDQSVGGSVTVGGGASGSLNVGQQKIDSDYASVTEQSGIKAGDGGFDIRVEGNTDLKGAVIASNQSAIDAGLNTLDTGTLTHADIDNRAEYDASSLSLGAGYSSDTGVSASTPVALKAGDSDSSTTHSGISGGVLTIRDADGQGTLANLKRDVNSEQDGSNALKPIFDQQEIETAFEITQAFVQESGAFLQRKSAETADAEKKLKAEQAKPEGERSQERIAELQQTVDDNATWGMGGAGRLMLTALSAGASGNVTGGTGEMLQASAVNFAQGLAAQGVKQAAGDDDTTRALLHGMVGCLGAAGQGGDCGSGALGGSGAVALNLLLDQMQGVSGSELTADQKEARSNLVASLLAGTAAASGGDAGTAGTAGRLETENNSLPLLMQYGPPTLNYLSTIGTRISSLFMTRPGVTGLVNTAGIGAVAYSMNEHGEPNLYDDVPEVPSFENMIAADPIPGRLETPSSPPEVINVPYPAEDQQKPEPVGGGFAVGGKPDVPNHTDGSPIVENGPPILPTPVAEQFPGAVYNESFDGVGGEVGNTLGDPERGILTEANFAQSKIKSDRSFSPDGQRLYSDLAGKPIKTVEDLAEALKAGTIKPSQLPVDYVDMNGARLILNTRTSTALEQAGVPRDQWIGRNKTGVEAYPGKTFNDLAADQLRNNKLPPTGAKQLKSVLP